MVLIVYHLDCLIKQISKTGRKQIAAHKQHIRGLLSKKLKQFPVPLPPTMEIGYKKAIGHPVNSIYIFKPVVITAAIYSIRPAFST